MSLCLQRHATYKRNLFFNIQNATATMSTFGKLLFLNHLNQSEK